MGRRLIFPLFTHTGGNQHHDGYDIRQHLKERLRLAGKTRNKQIHDIQTAKEDGAEDAHIGAPDSEDNQGDGVDRVDDRHYR